jgi:hypothetical protein
MALPRQKALPVKFLRVDLRQHDPALFSAS